MKRISAQLLLILAVCAIAMPLSAQNRDRKQFRDDIREYKHNFLRHKLDMSREQATEFFAVYDQMDDAITALNDEARAIESKIYDAPDGTVTDLEYEMATKTLLEVKGKESQIENEYYDKFKDILNKKQLFELRRAERDFTIQLVKHHKNGRKK